MFVTKETNIFIIWQLFKEINCKKPLWDFSRRSCTQQHLNTLLISQDILQSLVRYPMIFLNPWLDIPGYSWTPGEISQDILKSQVRYPNIFLNPWWYIPGYSWIPGDISQDILESQDIPISLVRYPRIFFNPWWDIPGYSWTPGEISQDILESLVIYPRIFLNPWWDSCRLRKRGLLKMRKTELI